MNLFSKRREEISDLRIKGLNVARKAQGIEPIEELYFHCKKCGFSQPRKDFEKAGNMCTDCKSYYPLRSARRVAMVADLNSFSERDANLAFQDPLFFPEYAKKAQAIKMKTGLSDAVLTGTCTIDDIPCAIGIMDTQFLMGSMGTVLGEKITRLAEYATDHKLPLILFSASGGARMQEGIFSLMQMAKTAGAMRRHSDEGLLSVVVLTHPTTGGVTASFASLADIILAEPRALVGFAGPRVIEQTIGEKLPEGFQRSEALLEQGFVDAIVTRAKIRETLAQILVLHSKKGKK